MLQIKNLTIRHRYDLSILMENVNFVVNSGDKLAIIGQEGNGKSTLLHYILQQNHIHSYLDISGELVNQFSKVGYLPQALPEELLQEEIESFFFADIDVATLDYTELYKYGSQLAFDIDRLYSQQTLKSLSGGERIKVQLLKLLMIGCDLLLLDEPSNDLDIETLNWLTNFIKNTTQTVIFISHDEALLEETATSVLHLERLQHKERPVATFANLPYSEYIGQKESKFNQQMKISLKQREEHDKKMARHHRIEQSVTQQLRAAHDATAGRLLAKKMKAVKSTGNRYDRETENFDEVPIKEDPIDIRFSNTQPVPHGKQILHLYNETIDIDGDVLAKNLELTVNGSDKIGIIGQNGIGKSTFLKKIEQKLANTEAVKVGYMPQNYDDILSPEDTPISFLSETGSAEERTQIMTYLGSMKFLPGEMSHSINALSGGQRAKLFLLKFDLQRQNVLLLDEPSRNFSPTSQGELRQVFKDFPGAIITVSHNRRFLQAVCNRIVELTPDGFVDRSDMLAE